MKAVVKCCVHVRTILCTGCVQRAQISISGLLYDEIFLVKLSGKFTEGIIISLFHLKFMNG